jgi:hypothetical protein
MREGSDMPFQARQSTAEKLITVTKAHLWDTDPAKGRLILAEYGYETHIPEEGRKILASVSTATSLHLRFAPDFVIIDKVEAARSTLVDFKVTQTPLWSTARIAAINRDAEQRCKDRGLKFEPMEAEHIGQMEANASDIYSRLASIGIRVAVLNYCAYASPPLRCDFIERYDPLTPRAIVRPPRAGSGTPFVNFDIRPVRTLRKFISDEFAFDYGDDVETKMLAQLKADLPKL